MSGKTPGGPGGGMEESFPVWIKSQTHRKYSVRERGEVPAAEDAVCEREITFNLNSQLYLELLAEAAPTASDIRWII